MPVTARLSKRFYDRLGDEIANELVEWFNQVDATYRSDLKEINERNFALFDARLEQRFAQFDTRFAQMETHQAQFETRVERSLKEHTRWMLAAWATQMAAILALYAQIYGLLHR